MFFPQPYRDVLAGGPENRSRSLAFTDSQPTSFLERVSQRQSRVRLGHAPEADQPFALELHAVAPDESLLAFLGRHERAVRALIDQLELVLAELDARMQARDEVAL